MRKLISLVVAILSIAMVTSVQAETSSAPRIDFVVNGFNEFAFDFYRLLGKSDQNTIVSPYSLSSVLNMLANGSVGNTRAQFLHVLHINTENDLQVVTRVLDHINATLQIPASCHGWVACKISELKHGLQWGHKSQDFAIANAIWADENIPYKRSFINSINENQSVNFFRVNFAQKPDKARELINNWIEHETQGYIKNLLEAGAVTKTTKMILTNAIYFKGLWQLPFERKDTEQQTFTLQNGNTIQVPMMKQSDHFDYAENDTLQCLQMSYSKSTLAMAILLPKPNHSLQEIRNAITQASFMQLLQMANNQAVIVTMPKFTIESTFDSLKDTLESLGLTEAFSDKADFSNMTMNPIAISDIIQKAVIKVDEEGTVAAAATAAVMVATAYAPQKPPTVFKANHPFLYIIYDTQSKMLLFMGQVTHP